MQKYLGHLPLNNNVFSVIDAFYLSFKTFVMVSKLEFVCLVSLLLD